jgi:hypothetical protein
MSPEIRPGNQVFTFVFSLPSRVANRISKKERDHKGNKQTMCFQMSLISMQCPIVPDVCVRTHNCFVFHRPLVR